MGLSKTSGTSSDKPPPPAAVDFSALVMGFSSAALYYLGETPLEGKSAPQKNLVLARQNIDIIAMLQDKTRGNLAEDESRLVEQLISDLKVRLVQASK